MHALLENLHRDHVNLDRLLELLESHLNAFYSGEESDFDLIIELLEYLECYAELVHHPTEDLIFEAALDRSGDKRPTLEKLMGQHKTLVELTRKFRQSMEGVIQGAVMTREELEIEGREYIALQRLHLDTEEGEIFDFLDDCLDEPEWRRIEESAPKYDDPVFGERDPDRFRILYRYLFEHQSAE